MRAKIWALRGLAIIVAILVVANRSMPSATNVKPSSSPPQRTGATTPWLIRAIRRYGLADLATVIGVPLALLALLLTVSATRDTARQIRIANDQVQIARAQSQPTFRIIKGKKTLAPRNSGARWTAFNELSLTMNGNARDAAAFASSFFYSSDQTGFFLTPIDWWEELDSDSGHVAQWRSNLDRLTPLLREGNIGEEETVFLVTNITITYTDLFGQEHAEYYRFKEIWGDYWWGSTEQTRIPNNEAELCSYHLREPEGGQNIPFRFSLDDPVSTTRLRAVAYKRSHSVFARCV